MEQSVSLDKSCEAVRTAGQRTLTCMGRGRGIPSTRLVSWLDPRFLDSDNIVVSQL